MSLCFKGVAGDVAGLLKSLFEVMSWPREDQPAFHTRRDLREHFAHFDIMVIMAVELFHRSVKLTFISENSSVNIFNIMIVEDYERREIKRNG